MRIPSAVVITLVATLGSAPTAFGQSFTDDPLTVGTAVKAVHVTELRSAVATLRATFGLSVFAFTDPTVTPGVTVVRAVHLAELRSALDAVYDAAGKPHPTYTDPVLAGVAIKAVHIQQLRAAVFNAINDAPSFTKGANQTVTEDAGAQTVVGWATAISAGPGETTQTVTFVIDTNTTPGLFAAGPSVASNGTLTYTPAANQNGVATITLHAHDDGGTAGGGVDNSPTQSFTITVAAINDAPVVTNKVATAQANMRVAISGLLGGVTDVDSGVNGCTPTFSVTNVSATTPAGGVMSNLNAAAGTLDLDPPPGVTGAMTFTYTVADTGCPGTATSAPVTVTVTVTGPVIWFVDSTAPGGGNGIWTGTNARAFQTLAQADAVNVANDRVFVINNNASPINYAGGLVMQPGERLIGQGVTGVSFDAVVLGLTPPAGTVARPGINGVRPTLQGTTTLADGVTVTGVNFTPNSAVAAITASALATTAAITIDQVIASGTGGATSALSLTNVTATGAGALNVSNASFTNTSAAELLVSGGNIPISLAAPISSNAGRSIDIQNRTGGTVTLSGAITDTATGIFLNGNTGSTINFTGALTLTTGANPGFTATGGGTVSNSSGVVNTISTTTGTALTVSNTTIGASGLTFRSISVNGAANGIVLTATGSTGGLTVTGDGSTGAGGLLNRNASGGTIQNTTDDCIRLTSAQSVTLRQMDFLTCGNTVTMLAADAAGSGGEHAVEVVGGSNVVLSAITINNPASTGILILSVGGTNRVNNNSLITHIDGRNAGGLGHGLYVYNNNVNMTLFDFRNSQITNNVAPNATFFVANGGTANMQADVRDSVFDDLSNQALTMAAGGVVTTTGTLTSNVINNDFINAKGLNENNLGVLVNNGATHVSLVQDNLFDNIAKDGTIANTSILRTQNSGGTLNATVTANTIQNITYTAGNGGRHAIGHVYEPVSVGAGASNLVFTNNTISSVTYPGLGGNNREAIFVDYRVNANGGEVTIQGNTFSMPTAGTQQAIELRFRQTNPNTVAVLVRGNAITHNTAVNFLDVDAEDGANVQLTVDGNNNFTNSNGTPGQTIAIATEDPAAPGGPPSMCVNISGNTLQSGSGTIELNESAGTLTVTQASAAALAAGNGIPGGNVTVLGAPAFGVPACTLP